MGRVLDAVVRVYDGPPHSGGTYRGCAFVIGRFSLVTCCHVIDDIDPDNIFLEGGAWEGGGIRKADEVANHDDRDVAVIRVNKPVSQDSVLLLAELIGNDLTIGTELNLLGCTAGDRSIQSQLVIITAYDGQHNLEIVNPTVQEGMSGGPALLEGQVVGITQAKEDANTLIIPIAAFYDFVIPYSGNLSLPPAVISIQPVEIESLKKLIGDLRIPEAVCKSLYVKAAPTSRPPPTSERPYLWICVESLALKINNSNEAPLFRFLNLASEEIAKAQEEGDAGEFKYWCSNTATRLGVTQNFMEANANSVVLDDECAKPLLIVVIEPRDHVDPDNFVLRAWLWIDASPMPITSPNSSIPRGELEKSLITLTQAATKELGVEAARLTIEVVVPFSLFGWNVNRLALPAGPNVELLGAFFPVSLRSWQRLYHQDYSITMHKWPARWKQAPSPALSEGYRIEILENSEDCCTQLYNRLKNTADQSVAAVSAFLVPEIVSENIENLFGSTMAAGLPLAFWMSNKTADPQGLPSMITEVLETNSQESLPAAIFHKRKTNPQTWMDVVMLWDNPQRLPPDLSLSQT